MRPTRTTSPLPWLLVISAFLLFSFAAALRAELPAKTSRTDSCSAPTLKSLSLENVSGDVAVTAGPSFTARADITVRARTEKAAQKALSDTSFSCEIDKGEATVVTELPGTRVTRRGKGWRIDGDDHAMREVEARYTITVPAGASLDLQVVNGRIAVQGVTGGMKLSSVNGRIEITGARGDLKVNTVNGNIDAAFPELPKGTEVRADTVNGNITLRLPAGAGFQLSGRTMSGDILSTFALPAASDADEVRRERERLSSERARVRAEKDRLAREIREKTKQKVRVREDAEEIEVDLTGLQEALAEMEHDLTEMSRDLAHSVSSSINRSYEGTVGGGGATIRCSNLNGRIVLLAEGTAEAAAKSIIRSPRTRIIEVPRFGVPRVVVRAPKAPSAPAAPVAPQAPSAPASPAAPAAPAAPRAPRAPMAHPAPPEPNSFEGSIVRGDIDGDFYTSLPMGDVRVGKVSGKVKISTQAGQIRVEKAGAGAELTSSGGDVKIDTVTGSLRATTFGGDIVVGSVSGDARLETMGGDITLRSGGAVTAKTGGGDIRLEKVKGPVRADTGGGGVAAELASADPGGPSELRTGGGDVVLTLPANFRGELDIRVSGVDSEGDYVVSQFPELQVSKRHGSQSAQGKLNGGGPKVTVRTSSGTVTIRQAAPAAP